MTDIFVERGISGPALFLAPMEGITNHIYRNLLIKNEGVDFVATEFVRITSSRQKLKPFPRHNVPLQIQLMSARPEELRDCIVFLKDREILLDSDWIDLNVGCPSKRVNASGAGAALLLEPAKLVEMTNFMREVHPGPLSIKTRVGYQSDENYSEILAAIADCPIDFIAIHARTKCAGYTEPVNLKHLEQAVKTLSFPVIGNGDIWSAKDALNMLDKTGVRGLMCGRGAVINPFLFKEIKSSLAGTEINTLKSELLNFYFQLLSDYETASGGELNYMGVFKEFTTWFSRNDLIGKELFQATKRCQTYQEIAEAARSYFGMELAA